MSGCAAGEKAGPLASTPSIVILSPLNGQVSQGSTVTVSAKVSNFALKEHGGANRLGEGLSTILWTAGC